MDNALVDLSMSLFSKMVGMQINKTEEEINQSYMDYLDNFYKINGDLLNLSNKLHDLRLHISFEPYKYGKKYIPSFLVNKIETVVSPVEKLAPVSEKKNTKCNSGKSLTEVVVKAPEPKPVNANLVIIDMNDDKIQTDAIRIIDNPRRITMRKRIDDMEIDLIKAFFYIIYEESISYMAKLLGLNYTTLFNRIKVYKTSHRVVYKNAQNLI